MSRYRAWILLLAALIIQTGCTDSRILEQTGFIHAVSYDWLPQGKIKYGIKISIANPGVARTKSIFMHAEAINSRKASIELSGQTNLQLVSGQMRIILIGLPLAKAGPWSHMDNLVRDPTISEQTKIIVTDGMAADLLSKNYVVHPRTGEYIDRLIRKETKGHTVPESTIYSFSRDYYDDGIEPVTPMIRDTGNTIAIDGLALFKKDKFVGKISHEDMIYFTLLLDDLEQGEVGIDLSDISEQSKSVMIDSMISSQKVEVRHSHNEEIDVNISVTVTATVSEYIGNLDLNKPAELRTLEDEITVALNQHAEKIITMLQENKADNLGIGKHVRNSMTYDEWKKLNWEEVYSAAKIRCNLQIKIKDHGFR